jgi:hypothetical protein
VKTPKAQIFLASGGGTSKQLFPGVLFLNNTAPCKKFMADCSDMGSSKQIHSVSAKKNSTKHFANQSLSPKFPLVSSPPKLLQKKV